MEASIEMTIVTGYRVYRRVELLAEFTRLNVHAGYWTPAYPRPFRTYAEAQKFAHATDPDLAIGPEKTHTVLYSFSDCMVCGGSGEARQKWIRCIRCLGKGCPHCHDIGIFLSLPLACSHCHGRGKIKDIDEVVPLDLLRSYVRVYETAVGPAYGITSRVNLIPMNGGSLGVRLHQVTNPSHELCDLIYLTKNGGRTELTAMFLPDVQEQEKAS